MSIELVMTSNHLILCYPLLLLPSIFPSIRVFSNELALRIRRPKYWNFSIIPSNELPPHLCQPVSPTSMPTPLPPDSGCGRGQMWGSRMPAGLQAGTRGWESHSELSSGLALSSLRAQTLEPDCPSSNLRPATFFQCDTGQVFNLSESHEEIQFPHGGHGDDNCTYLTKNWRSYKHKASDMIPSMLSCIRICYYCHLCDKDMLLLHCLLPSY